MMLSGWTISFHHGLAESCEYKIEKGKRALSARSRTKHTTPHTRARVQSSEFIIAKHTHAPHAQRQGYPLRKTLDISRPLQMRAHRALRFRAKHPQLSTSRRSSCTFSRPSCSCTGPSSRCILACSSQGHSRPCPYTAACTHRKSSGNSLRLPCRCSGAFSSCSCTSSRC